MNKKSKFLNLAIKFDYIEKEIIKFLKKIKITQKAYNEYVEFMKNQLDDINDKRRTEANRIQIKINRLISKRKDYIKKYM
jgi:hypothetical protein